MEILLYTFRSTVTMSYPADNNEKKRVRICFNYIEPKSFAERDRRYEEYVSEGAEGNE